MVNFFIADQNVINQTKLPKKIKADEIIIRDRQNIITKQSLEKNLSLQRKYRIKPMICNNIRPIIYSRFKGIHISLFYDVLISKIPKFSLKSVSCHDVKQIIVAKNEFKANFIFISPVFLSKSHPNSKALGIIGLFKMLNQVEYSNFIVLGGIDEGRFKKIKLLDFNNKIKGFAGIRNFLDNIK